MTEMLIPSHTFSPPNKDNGKPKPLGYGGGMPWWAGFGVPSPGFSGFWGWGRWEGKPGEVQSRRERQMRRAFILPERDEEEEFFVTMKRRHWPHTAQSQCCWAPRQPILTNSSWFLPKFFKGLGKRHSGHLARIFHTYPDQE